MQIIKKYEFWAVICYEILLVLTFCRRSRNQEKHLRKTFNQHFAGDQEIKKDI